MTTGSMGGGLRPPPIGRGAAPAQRSAIAVTIIGGQTLCLMLSLLVVPVGYSLVEDAREWLASRRRSVAVQSPAAGD